MLKLTLREHVAQFLRAERPIQMLDEAQVLAQAVAAVRFLAGFAVLSVELAVQYAPLPPPQAYDADTCLDLSEWALVKPLFLLYLEREMAHQLEASRGMGIDVFGRSTSEIAGDIAAYEVELQRRAFSQPFVLLV